MLALVEARRRGFTIDEDNLKLQIEHTAEHLKRAKTRYLDGRGTGGGYVTAGYALAALEAGGWKPDEATAATCEYLVWKEGRRALAQSEQPAAVAGESFHSDLPGHSRTGCFRNAAASGPHCRAKAEGARLAAGHRAERHRRPSFPVAGARPPEGGEGRDTSRSETTDRNPTR